MKQIIFLSVALLLAALLDESGAVRRGGAVKDHSRSCTLTKPRVVCYYATWPYGYSGLGKFSPSDINPQICTHLMYSFVDIGADASIILTDEYLDIELGFIADFVAMKEQNPSVKVMAAIGGWSAGSANFSIVAGDETLRATFANNSAAFLAQYGFDGLDLDWEYPSQRDNSTTEDKANFVLMVQALKDAFADQGYLLSAAVAALQSSIDLSYDVPALSELLDFINIMTYDFHGTWDSVTGVNAPLYPQVSDAADSVLTVNSSVNVWIANGADPAKLNVGLGNYGHAYTLADASNNGTGAAITDAAYISPYSGETSTWTYLEICSDQLNNTSEWTIVNNNNSYVYAVKENLWIGYDDVDTIYAKAAFAKEVGVGGIMFWALHGDDFQGYCSNVTYPLIKAGIRGYANA